MTTPTPEQQAANDAVVSQQLRELAQQITDMSKLPFDPMTIRKAIVTAVADTTTPPTVSLNIAGDVDSLVTQVRTLNNYTPLVGQTVLLVKQGTEIFILGSIASVSPQGATTGTTSDNGWIRATISNGTHGGNSNGDIFYRRIMDHGSWKMQWRGGWAPGGATGLISTADALDADYRPAQKRSVLCAREIQTGATSAQFDFNTDGSVILVGPTTTAGSASVSGSTTSDGGFTVGTHYHTYVDYYGASGEFSLTNPTTGDGGFSIGSHSHSFSGGSHTHAVTAPAWVSLNGVEYFL